MPVPAWDAAWRPLSWLVGVGVAAYSITHGFNPSGLAFACAAMGLPSALGRRVGDR